MRQRNNDLRSTVTGRFAPGWRLATHNIRGFRGHGSASPTHKVGVLFNEWQRLQLRVVCVQEVKIGSGDFAATGQVERALHQAALAAGVAGYKVFWGCRQAVQTTLVGDGQGRRRSRGGNASGGVTVIVRQDLLRDQSLQVVRAPSVDQDGRLMHMHLHWSCTSFTLTNVYLPSGQPRQQQGFVRERLGPLLRGCSGAVILAGDFNFTSDWRKDRAWVAGVGQGGARPESHKRDERPSKAMGALARDVGMTDAFRRGRGCGGVPGLGWGGPRISSPTRRPASRPGPGGGPAATVSADGAIGDCPSAAAGRLPLAAEWCAALVRR